MGEGSSEYTYELWRGGHLVSTGQLQRDEQLSEGDRLRMGDDETIVRRIIPTLEGYPPRIVLWVLGR